MGVSDEGGEMGFALKQFDSVRIARLFAPQQFDRDFPFQSKVAGTVNLGRAVAAD
jgi:hypothetical protein